jgi:hypothetical protein
MGKVGKNKRDRYAPDRFLNCGFFWLTSLGLGFVSKSLDPTLNES